VRERPKRRITAAWRNACVIAAAAGLVANARAEPHGLALALAPIRRARTADNERAMMAARQLRVPPAATTRRASASARGSAANARGVPRWMLRENWSSTTISASAPSGVPAQ
jgi:hypothetical protein